MHEYLYWEFHENKSSAQAARIGNFKVVRHDPLGAMEVYNIKEDLSETNDISKFNPEITEQAEAIFNSRSESIDWPLKSKLNN